MMNKAIFLERRVMTVSFVAAMIAFGSQSPGQMARSQV